MLKYKGDTDDSGDVGEACQPSSAGALPGSIKFSVIAGNEAHQGINRNAQLHNRPNRAQIGVVENA